MSQRLADLARYTRGRHRSCPGRRWPRRGDPGRRRESTGSWAARSRIGFTVIFPGACAPVADLAGGAQLVALPRASRCRRLRGLPCSGGRRARPAAGVRRWVSRQARHNIRSPGVPRSRAISRAGELSDRGGTADVQRVFLSPNSFKWAASPAMACSRSSASARSSSPCTGTGAGVGDLLLLDGEVPAVGLRQPAVLGQVGHERGDRLVHQPFELDGSDLVRHGCDVPVHERRRRLGEQQGLVRDPAGQPRPEITLDHTVATSAGQPVGELQGVADVSADRRRWTLRSRRRTR